MEETAVKKRQHELLSTVYSYIIKNGLENIHIRDLCQETGIAQGSIYYWYKNKENLIYEAACFGLEKVTVRLMELVYSGLEDIDGFFKTCLKNIQEYKEDLRFMYQLTSSPVYGDHMRSKEHGIIHVYEKYSKDMAYAIGCDEKQLRPLVYLFMSAILDYVIWEDKEVTNVQLKFIYLCFKKLERQKFGGGGRP